MDGLKRLIVEAHRRSLWQVLGVYVLSSWAVLSAADTLTGVWGLPDWVPHLAFVFLLIGLPIVLATAVVQEGGPRRTAVASDADSAPEPKEDDHLAAVPPSAAPADARSGGLRFFLQRHLTWRRSLLGGVAALALLGFLVAGYFASWALGVGPVGSLLAAGELEEGDQIVLADFRSPESDPELGAVVTDALRIDLLGHPTIRPADDGVVRELLERMQADPDSPLTPDRAREVAVREGLKAVLEGEVAEVGSGYVLSATLRSDLMKGSPGGGVSWPPGACVAYPERISGCDVGRVSTQETNSCTTEGLMPTRPILLSWWWTAKASGCSGPGECRRGRRIH